MRTGHFVLFTLAFLLVDFAGGAASPAQNVAVRNVREYRDYAMGHDGDATRGRALFNDQNRVGCVKCHSVDGSSSKAGPDLFAIGDKFPRSELIRAILEPSAEIAVGYSTTILETLSGEVFEGVIKDSTADVLDLIGGDGRHVRISKREIQYERGSKISLMPEGLQASMSLEEFSDLVGYLTTLQQPASALTSDRGMPAEITELSRPVSLRPLLSEQFRFPHAYVHKPGDVRYGIVWFSQVPGCGNTFVVVHQTGKIWLLETK
ncbi:MAG TPA: hypothetical protein VL793_14150, partial [Patescibacteria group bacterium]|nr:hypothetical protein [Patescibacteria group bacterium]